MTISRSKKPKVTLDDFQMFDTRAAQRDPSAVSKDIAKLAELGLVHVVVESNAGHGVKKIVQPVAENIEISAAVL